MIAAAAALVVLASLLLLAAPQSARAQTEIWDATLTVGADGDSRGFLSSPSRGSLSDTTFEAGGVSFTIRALLETHATNRKFICVSFQAGYTGDHAATTALSTLTLNVGGHTLPFEGINHGQRPYGDYCWFIPGPAEDFGFETGSTLPASIVTSAPKPAAQITSRPRDGTTYRSGEVIRVVLWFEEDVRVTGSPQLELEIGGRMRLADYVAARRGRTAAFEYTVTADDDDDDGVSIRANTDAMSPSLRLNGGEFLWVSFLRGEVVDLGFGAVPAGAGHAVDGANADTTAPVLSAATIGYGLLELTYSEPLRSDPQMMSGVATSAWSVSVNGAPAALTAAYIIGTVQLVLQSPVDHDDVVTVSSSVLMQDRAEPPNTEAALLDGHSVTNETPAAKPVVEIAADADALFEGEAILLTVTRTGETAQPLRVTVSFSNPALLGLAFPTVYLPAGASSGRATVPTRRQRPPGDRPLVISLVPDDPYVIGEASSVSVTVKDVDVPVAVSIGASLNIANEPPTAGAIDYVAVVAEALEESPVAPEFRFLFSTQPGTAEKDKDYRAQDHRLGFRAEDFAFVTRRLGGQEVQRWQATRRIPIEYLGDDEAEGDEYFTVHVEADSTTPENVTFFERPLKVIIRDSDLDIDVAIRDPPSQIAENAGRSHITLAATVRQPSTPAVSSGVRLTLEEDSASVPEDVAWAGSDSRTIPVDLPASLYRPVTENGATHWRAVVSVPLLVHDDDIEEERERFRVNLTRDSQAPNSGYVEIARATNSARLTIVDDDQRGLVVNPTALDLAPGAEGSYTVALASEPTADVTVTATVPAADAGAVSLSPSSLAFTPGNWDTPQSLTVTAGDDADGRTVEIANQAAGGDYGVVDPVAVEVEIASGAMQPAPPALAVSDAAASEADAEIAFTVSLDAAGTRQVTVRYETENGTAEAGADFTGTDGVLTFAAGETSRTVVVPVIDDDAAEPGESFSLRLRAPVNAVLGDALGVGRITDDDDLPMLSVTGATVSESDGAVDFDLTLSAASGREVSVQIRTDDGTAVQGRDYGAVVGEVRFAAGETHRVVGVAVTDDLVDEPDLETFTLTLSSPENATLAAATATGSIRDDDVAPVVSARDTIAAETGGEMVFSVVLTSRTESTVTVDYETVDVTATAGSDYRSTSGTLTYAPGETAKSVAVTLLQDTVAEGDEVLTLSLDDARNARLGASGDGTIRDGGAPALRIADATAAEASGALEFVVTASGAAAREMRVDYATRDGTATAGQDYTETQGTLVFAVGETTKTIRVPVAMDSQDDEGLETLTVVLSGAVNATLADSEATGTISDTALPRLSVSDVSADEGDDAVFAVSLTVAAAQDVSFRYRTADGTATAGADYTEASGRLTIPAGETSASIMVSTAEDGLDEDEEETFEVRLEQPLYATIDDGAATGTIRDADPTPTLSVADATTDEGESLEFAVTLSAASALAVTVDFETEDGTAESPADYTHTTGTLTFGPGETERAVPVPVYQDRLDEDTEYLSLVLKSPTNAGFDGAEELARGFILDDDDPPVLELGLDPIEVAEQGETSAVLTVEIAGDSAFAEDTTVGLALSGPAQAGVDYRVTDAEGNALADPWELVLAAGEDSVTARIQAIDDEVDEEVETVTIGAVRGRSEVGSPVTLRIADDDEAGVVVSPAALTLAEGGTKTYTVALASEPTASVTVTVSSDNEDVTAGGPLTFIASDWSTAQTVTVTAAQDANATDDTATLTNTAEGGGYDGESAGVTVTVTDDETAPTAITLTASPGSVLESASGTTVTVTATLDGSVTLGSATQVTVSVGGGSATSGADYTAVSDFTVTIPKETASGTGTFTLTPTNDSLAEGEETIDVTGMATDFTVTKAEMTLTDDETAPASITLTVSPVSVGEDDAETAVRVTATLDGSVTLSTATEVTVSVGGGTATSGTDYTAVSNFTVTIPKESASETGTFTLTPTQDTIAEGDETIDVTGEATGFTVTKAEMTLTDDETAPASITLTASPASVSESASGTEVTVTATLGGSATLLTATTVTVSVGGGSATSGTDYTAVSDFTVTIPKETASGTGTFTLTSTQDAIAEGDETIDVTGTADGFTVTKAEMTLTDDETAPASIALTVSPTSVSEDAGATTVTVTATLGGSATLPDATEVTVSVGGGTATSGTDYTAVSNFTVTIPEESASGTGTFTLTPTNDSLAEGEETIDVTGTATDFTVTKAQVTLTDDVPPVEVSFARASYTVAEGGTVTVTVELSAVPEREVEVALTHTARDDTTAADYSGVPTSVTFAADETEQTFTFTAAADDVDDDGDSVLLGFGTPLPDGVSAGATATSTVSITDDDVPPVQVFFEPDAYTVAEDSAVTVTVRLDVAPERLVSVPITVANQGDTTAADYSGAPTLVVFAGDETEQSFPFGASDDTVDDDDESVVLGFGELPDRVSAPDTTARPASATVSITDDDTASASITLTTLPATVSESASETTVTVTATLGGSVTLGSATQVTVSVGGGTATSGTDYAAVSDFTVTIPKETASGTGTFTLTPTQDTIAEGDETIDVTGSATDFTVTKAEITLTDDDTAPASIALTVSPTSVSEDDGATTVTVTATLGGSATRPGATEVTVSVGGGSATSGTDYAAVSSFTVTIPKETASGTGTFTLSPTQDNIAEGDESIDVTGSATDFTVTKAEMTLTDDETAPASITLTTSPTSVGEDDGATTVTVTATLGGSATLLTATEVTVSVGGGSATSGTDYAAVSSFTVTIPKETASGTGTFTLTPTQDTIAEGDETIDVTGSATDFTVTKAEMTLADDETAPATITLTTSPTSLGEDDGATIVTVTATLGGSATRPGATEVTVSVGGGTATSATDYTAVSNFTVTIPKETASGAGTFTLTPTQDTIAEGDESIDVTGSATDFTVTKAEMTLTDDETAPASITLTTSPTSVGEDDGATTVTVTATLGGSATRPGATEVTVSVGGGTATSGTDYTAVSNFTVTIPEESASGTGTFTLTPTNDSLAEGEETIDVTGTATDFTVTKAQVTLTDDVPPVEVSFARASYTVAEGGTVTVTVELSAVPEREVEVALTHTARDDTTAADYSGVPTSVTFAADETEQTFTFTAAADDVDDDGDSVLLGFGTPLPDGVSAGATATSTVSITDDDVPPVQVFFEPDAYTVAEDSAVTVTVRLDVAPERLVSVPITVANQGDTTAADYSGAPTLVVFAGDETEQSFPFGASDDTVDDDDESVVLGFGELPDRVSAPDTTARPASATVSITDDDTASASITLTTLPATVSESASETTVTVTATLGGSVTLGSATQVTVSVGGGTATSGTDYAAVSDFTVTIPKETASGTGTFTLTPTQDTIAEGGETIDVTGSATDFTVTKAEMTLTDDETASASITLTTSPASVGEDDGATTVTVTATLGGSATLLTATTVTVSVGGGSATSGTDYAAVSDFTVTIPKETASGTGTFTLTPTQDTIAEGDETIDVTGSATDFTVTKAEITLTDDDTAPASIALTVSPTSVSEDDGATTVTVTATLGGSATRPGATEVTVSVGGGSATSGTDYAAVSSFTVTIPKETASGTGTFTLSPTQDNIAEGDESIDVTGSATDFTVTKAEMTLTDDETAPASITLTTSPTSVGEDDGATTVTVTATLGGSATLLTATEVTVSVGGGSATSGTDYAAVSSFTVTIPKETASGTGTFTLTPTQDTIAEGDETIDVTGSATDFTVTKAEMTLADDETAPATITLTTSPTSLGEDDGATIVTVTATLGGSATRPGATEVTVSVGGGTATSATDYTAVSNFTVTIPKETASGAGTFTLTPTQDTIAEGDESIDVTGSATDFTVTKAEMTLTDDETAPTAITLTTSPTSVGEDDGATTVTVTATLGGSATRPGATEVTVSVGGGSATSGTDYAAVSSFTVTIPKETASATGTFTLTPTQDTIAEGDETIDVTGSATDFTVTKAEMTLTDDETAPATITLSTSPTSLGEDDGATIVTVTATLGGSATLLTATTVTVSVGGGSATSGTDYAAVSSFTVTIPKETASATGTFTLTPTQDTIAEGDETIDVTGSATDFTVTKAEMTLTDDETASASITLTTSPASVGEDDGATTVTVTATLGGSATLLTATTVTVSVGGGSATSGTDYAAVSDFTVTIPKETASGTGTFTLTPTQDTIAEGDETIDVTGSATDFTVTEAEITLTDDDTAQRTVSFDKQVFTVREGATRQVLMRVDLSGPLDREVTIPLTTTHGSGVETSDYGLESISAEDYYAGNATWTSLGRDLVFAPAETAKIVRVTAVDDSIVEDDEVLELGFGTLPQGISPGSIQMARVTITDDDGDDGDNDNDNDNDDTNGPPVFTSPVSFSVAENGTAVGTVVASDSDDGDSVTGYALASGADRALFSIDAATGTLRFLAPPNHEEPGGGAWTAGDRVRVRVRFVGPVQYTPPDEPENLDEVVVDETGGTPSIGLRLGDLERRGLAHTASYKWGSGTDTLVFEYEVTAADGRVSAAEVVADSLARNGATIRNEDGYDAELEHLGSVWTAWRDVEISRVNMSVRGGDRAHEGGTMAFTVELEEASVVPLRAKYASADGTARAGRDYKAWKGAVYFEPGETRKTVRVPLLADAEQEDEETVRLRLVEAHASWPYDLVVDIVDDEAQGTILDGTGRGRVSREAPLTARFAQAPDEHDGASPFTVRIAFSDSVTIGNREFRDHGIQVAGGRATKVRKVNARRDLWEVTVEPESFSDVPVSLPPTGDCAAPGALCTDDGRALSKGIAALVRGPAALSVADARVREAAGASLAFAVTLDRPASGTVTVDYATADGSATAGADYTAREGQLTFDSGDTEKTVWVPVLDDVVDEGEETLTLTLSNASGARITDGVATGTIVNSDPLQKMWLSRFGRTVAGQVVDAVAGRLSGPLGGSKVTLGGQRIDLSALSARTGDNQRTVAGPPGAVRPANDDGPLAGPEPLQPARAASWEDPGTGHGTERSMAGREFMLESSFHLAAGRDEAGAPEFAAWGRMTVDGVNAEAPGDNGTTRIDGEVTTAIFGADAEWERWLAGVALSVSEGEATFDQPGVDSGTVESTLTSVNPYVRYEANDRLTAWGLLGYGTGDMTISGKSPVRTDLMMRLGATGARGVLLKAGEDGGIDLALRGDAFLVRMVSEAAANTVATKAEASRLRLVLEAGRSLALGEGAMLTPAIELGLRHDGGDAETGSGVEIGARIRYADASSGITVEASARTLVAHEDSGYREWGAGGSVRLDPGASGRGLLLSLSPVWGTPSSGVDRLWSARDAAGLAPAREFEAERRLQGEVGYGLAAFGGRGVLTPYAGLELAAAGNRTWRLGARWSLAPHLAMSLEGTRRNPVNDNAAEHELQCRFMLRW